MEQTITVNEFKILSRNFRRVSGKLLCSTDTHEAMRLAKQFILFINKEPIITDFVVKKNKVIFDMNRILDNLKWAHKHELPLDEDEEFAFIYQLLTYATNEFERYDTLSRNYAVYQGAKIADSIRNFNREVVTLLVNQITDYLEEMALELGVHENPNNKVIIQGNIGQMNYAEQGNITATQNNSSTEEQLNLLKELIPLLKQTPGLDEETKVDAIDYIEEIVEDIESNKEVKESKIRRAVSAVSKVKGLVDDTSSIAIKLGQAISYIGNIVQ